MHICCIYLQYYKITRILLQVIEASGSSPRTTISTTTVLLLVTPTRVRLLSQAQAPSVQVSANMLRDAPCYLPVFLVRSYAQVAQQQRCVAGAVHIHVCAACFDRLTVQQAHNCVVCLCAYSNDYPSGLL
jgi:hypothetical protein